MAQKKEDMTMGPASTRSWNSRGLSYLCTPRTEHLIIAHLEQRRWLTAGNARTQQDTTYAGVRDREAPGSDPGPPTKVPLFELANKKGLRMENCRFKPENVCLIKDHGVPSSVISVIFQLAALGDAPRSPRQRSALVSRIGAS
jgi:hypothetical protein